MIHPRAALISHIRTFVDTELAGLVRYDELEHYQPENLDSPPGYRPNRYEKHKEKAEVRFGNYNLIVCSPSEAPPLGNVRLQYLGGHAEGPLDMTTWHRLGTIIRDRAEPKRIAANG